MVHTLPQSMEEETSYLNNGTTVINKVFLIKKQRVSYWLQNKLPRPLSGPVPIPSMVTFSVHRPGAPMAVCPGFALLARAVRSYLFTYLLSQLQEQL